MNYPFEFTELILTDRILDLLGFTEYWGGPGDFGDRRLGIKLDKNRFDSNYSVFYIYQYDEKDDECDGYGYGEPQYVPSYYALPGYYYSAGQIAEQIKTGVYSSIYFLHELYDAIDKFTPDLIPFLESNISKYNMKPYLDSYKKFINKIHE